MASQVIVTVVGRNRPGVLADVTGAIAKQHGNVLDIHQKMVREYFNLFMIVELSSSPATFQTFKEGLERLGERKGFRVNVQHERIFRDMHRL